MSVTSSTLIKNTLKLGLAGATIAGIAGLFLIMSPDGAGTESKADILDLELIAPQTKTQKFVAALDTLGHEKPRVYDYNGTQVFFSTRVTAEKPRELIKEYQQTFVTHGVNSREWDVAPDPELLNDPEKLRVHAQTQRSHMLGGEVQVIYHNENRVVMSGAVLDPSSYEVIIDHKNKDYIVKDFHKLFKMHRHIEAEWNPVSKHTTVTASWSDEHFDITKTMPETVQDPKTRHLNNSPDLEIPACIACTRLTRFATIANDKPYVTQVFESTESTTRIANFYHDAMTSAGWHKMPGETLKTHLSESPQKDAEFLQFQRNARFVTITIHPTEDGRGSMITTMTTD